MIKVLASGSSGNCYLLETESETLILECGIRYKDILKGLNFDLRKVVGCLISHEHKDHCKAVNEIMKAGIDVYLSEGTTTGIEFKVPVEMMINRIHYLKHAKSYHIGEFLVVPFNTQHDVNEPLGFLIYHKTIGKILFATDTYYLKNTFMDIEHILIECNYSEDILIEIPPYRARVLKSHMSLETLKDTLKAWDLSKTKDITLIHISEGNGDPERFRKEIEELTGIKTKIAMSGLIIGG